MKFSYKFSNLLGTVYRRGNLLFTTDGSTVISPIGNRVTFFDLKNNKSRTLCMESTYNIRTLDLSPNGAILVAINSNGDIYFISMICKMVVCRHHCSLKVKCVKFSPDGKYFAICAGSKVFLYSCPFTKIGHHNVITQERVFHDATMDTKCIHWSSDSNFLAVGSEDKSIRLYSMERWANFGRYFLGGHTEPIVACFYEKNSYDITTISRDGRMCIWEASINQEDLVKWEPPSKRGKIVDDNSDDDDDVNLEKAIEKTDKEEKQYEKLLESEAARENKSNNDNKKIEGPKRLVYKQLKRFYLGNEIKEDYHHFKLTAAAYHQESCLLVVAFNNGSFYLYELPDITLIHSLKVDTTYISTIALNNTGDWIALGCPNAGQLLVWEWQSETYAMRQQGHSSNINSLAYSGDGQFIVTGGEDGRVKLWNTLSGFCVLTFPEQDGCITGVTFSRNRKFIVSVSLGGSARAYDLTRYRNFRTFVPDRMVQLSCVALDATDKFLAAGGQDFFDIYLWNVDSGQLLERLSGHEGPVSSLAFAPNVGSTELVSVSWDKTLKIWNAIESNSAHETIKLTSEGLYVTYKPSGEEVAVATLDGQISFFDTKIATQTGSIEGKKDLGSGILKSDKITTKKTLAGKAFTSLCYSTDGSYIIAGGQSKNVCIYNVKEAILIKKFVVTQNKSLDGVSDYISRRKLTEFGNLSLVEKRGMGDGNSVSIQLPGVKKGDLATRSTVPEIRVYSLQFSPTGQAWAAATTEGLLIYSLDVEFAFDPFELEIGITPETIKETLAQKEYSKALMMAFRLNEKLLTKEVIEAIPHTNIELVITNIADMYIERVLRFVATELGSSPHIEFYLKWVTTILEKREKLLQGLTNKSVLLLAEKNMNKIYDSIMNPLLDHNEYTIKYTIARNRLLQEKKKEEEEGMEVDTYISDEEIEEEF